jgi:hypothetical protein
MARKHRLSQGQAARIAGRTDKTLRNWRAAGLLPKTLTYEDIPRLRQLAAMTADHPAVLKRCPPPEANPAEGDIDTVGKGLI